MYSTYSSITNIIIIFKTFKLKMRAYLRECLLLLVVWRWEFYKVMVFVIVFKKVLPFKILILYCAYRNLKNSKLYKTQTIYIFIFYFTNKKNTIQIG